MPKRFCIGRLHRLALALFLMVSAELVLGHAVVTESSLNKEPIRAGHATTVALFFNANVELRLSRVFLVSKGDVYHPLEMKHGHKPGEINIPVPALEAGEYALKYKVFAADGHLTENAIRFSVAEEK